MSVLSPWFFVVFGVLWLMVFALAWSLARMAARADREDELRAATRESVRPAAPPPGAERPAVPSPAGRPGRGGQPDRAGAQERAARDALRCGGGRVDAAPVRCPIVDEGESR